MRKAKAIFLKNYIRLAHLIRVKNGKGLGLALAKEIAERLNGRVGFTSALDEDSTFFLEFRIDE